MGTDNTSNSKSDQTAATAAGSEAAAASAFRLGRIFGVVVQVRDMERSLSFYRDVLGLHVEQNDGALALLRGAGEVRVLALREIGPRATHYQDATGVARLAWQVHSSSDLNQAEQVLQRHGIRYDRPPGDAFDSIITSDPDGLSVVMLAADTVAGSPPARLVARE